MWSSFKTYGNSSQRAFETLGNQLFERYLSRKYKGKVAKFKVINGAGGDGGIEAYGELVTGKIIAIQSKYFTASMQPPQIKQIEKSITTALKLRPNISEYIIAIPRNIASIKNAKSGKVAINTESKRVKDLESSIKKLFPMLKITWWISDKILNELQQTDNDGIHRYWFEKETIDLSLLQQQLDLQKTNNWLKERYVPNLHAQGLIQKEINKLFFLKDYRLELVAEVRKVQTKINKTNKLLLILSESATSTKLLSSIKEAQNYTRKLDEIASILIKEIISSNRDHIVKSDFKEPKGLSDLAMHLDKTTPTNVEKNIIYNLRVLMGDLLQIQPIHFFKDISSYLKVSRKFIFGGPGTGKTQGLAYAVELCLTDNYPAILIRAKTANNASWTALLSDSLDIQGWSKNELFSALETLAIKNDVKKASVLEVGQEPNYPKTNALICIDGLEEDIGKEESWYDRIAETKKISKRYPRLKFVFSARHSFYNNTKDIDSMTEEVRLTGDGDVQINEVIGPYFAHYRIKGKLSYPLKGLTSLFALRLFCEEYKGKNLNEIGKVETTIRKLLNLKVTRLNKEFLKQIAPIKTVSENPLVEGLNIVSKMFYQKGDITRKEVVEALCNDTTTPFTTEIASTLLMFLAANGVLTAYERLDKTGVLHKSVVHYSVTYQSIIETLISEEIYQNIKTGEESEIPDILLRPIAAPLHEHPKNAYNSRKIPPNRLIIQNLVSRIFNEQGKLIGENDFLKGRFSEEQILNLQFDTILRAPIALAKKFEPYVKDLFFKSHSSRFKVLKKLIIPTAKGRSGHFDANWLHEILYNQTNPFERDKLWSDLDKEEMSDFTESETFLYNANSRLRNLLTDNMLGKPFVSQYAKYDEFPLILAWGLSTIDRELRENITTSLTEWGIINPEEYIKLLNKIFFCNDPQIQEDLSSITLGIASRIKKPKALKKIAKWSLTKIFANLSKHRNIIVRQGFRAIVERAYQFRLISDEDVKKARPKPMSRFQILKLDTSYLRQSKEEYYPIVHDLAWYVIKNAYQNFLTSYDNEEKTEIAAPDEKFLNKYRKNYGTKQIYPRSWGMSAALEYIRNLGLIRKKGSWFTDASHGSKSRVYTYEEKYTWLAVHYLQGYLADYLPYAERSYSTDRKWITDYSIITYLRNPCEDILDEDTMDYILDKPNEKWRIKEPIVEELPITDTIQADLEKIVLKDPSLIFKKWLFFKDFDFLENEEEAICLYGYTSLDNKSETLNTSLKIQACIVEKKHFNLIKKNVLSHENIPYWLRGTDSYQASPNTHVYSNPTDIVWMNWVEEANNEILITEDVSFSFTRTSITKRSTKGEKEVYIPSKGIRRMLGITDFKNDIFSQISGKAVGAISDISEGPFKDRQDLLVVNHNLLHEALEAEGLQIFWFAQVFPNKNPHNEKLKGLYAQRVKKYFLWQEGEDIKNFKFWDEQSSNKKGK